MNTLENAKQQREALILERFAELVKAPYGDFSRIGQLSDVLDDAETLKTIGEFLASSPQGKLALQQRPLLGKVDLQQLHQLPKNTLGYIYANHMIEHGFTPPPVPHTVDEHSFPGVHLLETHDIWHVVTGCDTDKAGEIQLQGFYTAQIDQSRVFLALLAKNLLKTAIEDIDLSEQHMSALVRGWTLGKEAKPLFGIEWNKLWEKPLDELRGELNLNGG